MLLDRPLRMPLATGATPVDLAFGLAILGFLRGAPLFLGSLLPDWTVLPVGLAAGLWGLGLLFLPFAMWKSRASDVELSSHGVRVLGGPSHGACIAWTHLGVAISEGIVDGTPAWTLTITGAPGDRVVRAESSQPDEVASLTALAATLAALRDEAASPRPAPRPTAHGSQILACPACGAPAPPMASAEVRCAFCGADVPVPPAIRAEVEALGRLGAARTASVRALRELLRWPPARRINTVLLLALPPLAVAWPVSGAFFDEMLQYRHRFDWAHGVLLFSIALAASTGLVLLARTGVAARRAVGMIFATFQARPPAREGEAYGCRACGAPLFRPAESPLAPCVYCRADNVIVLDLPGYAALDTGQSEALDALLSRARSERQRYRSLTLGALVLLVLSGAGLVAVARDARGSSRRAHAAPVSAPVSAPASVSASASVSAPASVSVPVSASAPAPVSVSVSALAPQTASRRARAEKNSHRGTSA